jgi:transposase
MYGMRYVSCEYKSTTTIIKLQANKPLCKCPQCFSRHIVKNGVRERTFIGVPIGKYKTLFRVQLQRYRCRDCDYDQQEPIRFAKGSHSYTHAFSSLVVDLLKMSTIKDVAAHLSVSWDMVKDIHKTYLKRHYKTPSLKNVRNIGIDEFAVRKGHIYKTIVVDLDTGHIVHVGNGKGKESLTSFWKRVRKNKVQLENIAIDLSPAFIAAVTENAPNAHIVFDHFHVVKLMNDAIDSIRRTQYALEKDLNKRAVLKGTRWLLLMNGKDIMDAQHRTRLENALSMNKPLAQAYYLKESLREIWAQINKENAEQVLLDWVEQARSSGQKQLITMANTIMAHRTGILAWYDGYLSTAKLEGINNKIKVLKRVAYDYRDEEYFKLRLFALHDNHITRNLG